MTARISLAEGFPGAPLQIVKGYIAQMSSPGMSPEPEPRGIYPRIEGEGQQYVMIPYQEIATAIARPRTNPWLQASMAVLLASVGALGFLLFQFRSDQQALQISTESQKQTLIKLTESMNTQSNQVIELAKSVQTLTGAISNMSADIRASESRIARSAWEIRRMEARLNATEARIDTVQSSAGK